MTKADTGSMMQVIEMNGHGASDVLKLAERPIPEPQAHEIVIKTAYAGVNRPDVLQRLGLYNPPPGASDLLGLEASGEVVAIGAAVSQWSVGDQVCALLPGGGYAQYVATPAAHALPIPRGLALDAAAALPETVFTVWSNLFIRAGLKAGERLLIHGGASGIGTTAIQLAHQRGVEVYATASSAEKCALCERLGAKAIAYNDTDFVDVLRKVGGANVILDMVGGSYIPRNIKALADEGRLVNIAFLQGPKAEVNFAQVMTRRLTLTGSTLRPQSDAAKAEYARQILSEVWPMIEAGRIAPVMDRTYPLGEAAAAHDHMESGALLGKIVLKVGADS